MADLNLIEPRPTKVRTFDAIYVNVNEEPGLFSRALNAYGHERNRA
ncbi:hypothetical protein [Rathayibacter toxicus]|nr:hypothetical protein [Rathayibacter toxicus]